jgi:hypothetical protein
MLAVTLGVSTIIGGEDEGHVIHPGTLLGVEVRAADEGPDSHAPIIEDGGGSG